MHLPSQPPMLPLPRPPRGQVGSFPNWDVWAEWNGAYRDVIRRFVKGDTGMKKQLATRLAGSADLCACAAPPGLPPFSLTFSLASLVAASSTPLKEPSPSFVSL
jgi:hypothetical protein